MTMQRAFAKDIMKNRLKVLRAERDWSQAELAGRLDVSRQAVNAIEVAEQLDPYGDFDVQSPAEKSFDRLVGDECIAGIADRN